MSDKLEFEFSAVTANFDKAVAKVKNELLAIQKVGEGIKIKIPSFADSNISKLSGAFNKAFSSAVSLEAGMNVLGTAIGTLLNPATIATTAVVGLGVAVAELSKRAIPAAKNLELSIYSMGALINTTVQFYDETNKPFNIAENLQASLDKAKVLLDKFRADAPKLVNIEVGDLVTTAKFALPVLGNLNITDVNQQADVIERISTAIKQLNPLAGELQFRQETLDFLNGNFNDPNAELGKLIATVNGGTAAFKQQYDEAKRLGQAYQFISASLNDFYASAGFAESTLANQESIIRDFSNTALQTIGNELLGPLKVAYRETYQAIGGETGVFSEQQKSIFSNIGTGLADVFAPVIPLIKPIIEIVVELGSILGDILSVVGNLLVPVGDLLGIGLQGCSEIFKALLPIVDFLENAISVTILGLYDLIKKIVVAIAKIIGSFLKKNTGDFGGFFEWISKWIQAIGKAFGKLNGALKNSKVKLQADLGVNISIPKIKAPTVGGERAKASLRPNISTTDEKGKKANSAKTTGQEDEQEIRKRFRQATDTINNELDLAVQQIQDQIKLSDLKFNFGVELTGLANETSSLEFERQKKEVELQKEKGQITDKEAKLKIQALEKEELAKQKTIALDKLSADEEQRKAKYASEREQTEKRIEALKQIANKNSSNKEFDKAKNAADLEKLQEELGLLGQINDEETKQYNQVVTATTAIYQKKDAILALNQSIANSDTWLANLKDGLKDIGQGFTNLFSNVFQNGKFSFGQLGLEIVNIFNNTIQNILNKFITSGISKWIESITSNIGNKKVDINPDFGGKTSGVGGFLGNIVGGIFGGARAEGGGILPNKAYLVGERGPELVIPRSAGTVLTNNKTTGLLSGGGGQTMQSSVYITINALDSKDVITVLSQPDTKKLIENFAMSASNRNARSTFT